MPKTDIAKSAERPIARQRDIFSAMWDDMDRLFERFERGWPHWPTAFGRDERLAVPELDVRESSDAITVEVEVPDVDEKDVSVTPRQRHSHH